MKNRKPIWTIVVLCALWMLAGARAHADAALLMEEPFGGFGAMNPTGHAAIYLTRVCAETPTRLRRCDPGEQGVVISRYHRVAGYDWIAIPLISYLYAVDDASQVPDAMNPELETHLRDTYRRQHLEALAPDRPDGGMPGGEWIQLVGASYDRKIYGFQVETSEAQDDALIARLNMRSNRSHFNLLYRNCADFARSIFNFYYPHSMRRNFIADTGITTPKQDARSLVKYCRHHRDLEFTTFVIPQIPGTIHRSGRIDGVVEAFIKSKKYVMPLAVFHPFLAGGLIAVYVTDGRFKPDKNAAIFDPLRESRPGELRMAERMLSQAGMEDWQNVAAQQPAVVPASSSVSSGGSE
jgi:hypothetical protein